MSSRAKFRNLPPRRWVTLRGGSCCRRIVKDGFHLPRPAVSGKEESEALGRTSSPSNSAIGNVACAKNPASICSQRSKGTGWCTEAETVSRLGQTQVNVNPTRQEQEQEQVVQPRRNTVASDAGSESGVAPARRNGETWQRQESSISKTLLSGKASSPSLFRLGPATPSAPFRAFAFPPPTIVNGSRGTGGRGMAPPHDATHHWQHYQGRSHFNTVQQKESVRQQEWTTQSNGGGIRTSTTTATSPPHGNTSLSQTHGHNGQRTEGGTHKSGLGSVKTANNVVTAPPEHSREGQFSAHGYPAQMQQRVCGSLGRECANPSQMRQPVGDQPDPCIGGKRKAEGEERPRKSDASEDVSRSLERAAPPAPSADDKATLPCKHRRTTNDRSGSGCGASGGRVRRRVFWGSGALST